MTPPALMARAPRATAASRHVGVSACALLMLVTGLSLLLVGVSTWHLATLVAALFISYGGAWAWCAADFARRYVLAVFLAPFGLFLLARIGTYLLVDGSQLRLGILGTNFTDELLVGQMLAVLTTSLIALIAGASLLSAGGKRGSDARSRRPAPARVRVVALTIFYVAIPFVALQALLLARSGQTSGFYEARLAVGLMPAPLEFVAEMATPAFFAYLASVPARRPAIFHSLVYLGVMGFTLITWQRSSFVLGLLLVGLYWLHRHLTAPKGERWVTVRYGLIAAIGGVALMGLLALLNTLRGRTRALGLPGGPAVDFLFDQGVSVNVIGYAIRYEGTLPHDRLYSFGQIIESIQAYLLPVFGGRGVGSGQTIERAAEGHQLSHAISYLALGDDYLRGSGYGSSFVAELLVDGGILAVVLGSMAMGAMLMSAPRLLNGPYFVRLFVLALLYGVMFAPRGGFTQFIVQALGTAFLAVYAMIAVTFVVTRHPDNREAVATR